MLLTLNNYKTYNLGSKARNLFVLAEQGYPVPRFFCVGQDTSEEEIRSGLKRYFPQNDLFSVRSCASAEDGALHSFAGQFQTFLRVKREDVIGCIRAVMEKGQALEYAALHGIDPASIRIQVIVQEMIEADSSGILFTSNPQGILNESVIVHGQGTGERIVSDQADTVTYYYHLSDQIYYWERTKDAPLLSRARIQKLIRMSQKVKALFQTECDLEYAWKDSTLFLLQVRPITTLQKDAPLIILDNSNIVESYPGLTLPLTQSFIRRAYTQVFQRLLQRLTGDKDTVKRLQPVLSHMVDTVNGRVYYRISNWYDILLFLPFHKKIIPIWQEMMGVKDPAVSTFHAEEMKPVTRLRTARSFFCLLLTCPRRMEALEDYFVKIQQKFSQADTNTRDNQKLLKTYYALQEMTVCRWDLTLVNDMYAFLFTGLLKACLKAKGVPNHALAANRAIRRIYPLDSLKPVQELIRLSRRAKKENRLCDLQKIQSREDYARYLKEHNDDFTGQLQSYIQQFGDRYMEELKLESPTFRTDPPLLIRQILQYAQAPPLPAARSLSDPKDAYPPPRLSGLSLFFARRAAFGIRNRERSRLNRSRLYGMMRTLVLRMGENLCQEGRIARREDIFWLYFEELEQEVKKPLAHLQERISLRKEQYEGFRTLPACSRLVFSGKVFDKHPCHVQHPEADRRKALFTGTPCSQGITEGRVLLIQDPAIPVDPKGRILVTRMTDPGWVFFIARANGIIAEKGSLLSHTAIVARELGTPAVVGIPGITECLKEGDLVRLDADTGTITLLEERSPL